LEKEPSITLPDGRVWFQEAAYAAEEAFAEASYYQRVFAGSIPKGMLYLVEALLDPDPAYWPGVQDASLVQAREAYKERQRILTGRWSIDRPKKGPKRKGA
jgi:hypothetical protein